MNSELTKLLDSLNDPLKIDLKDHDIWMALHKVAHDNPTFESEAEKMAFYISEVKGIHIQSEWDFFYPHTSTEKEGKIVEFPKIEDININVINYWKNRSNETQNLYMKLRYTGLVFVFEKIVLKESFNYELFKSYINLLIEKCQENTEDWIGTIRCAERALILSQRYRNEKLIKDSISNLINLEERIANIQYSITWGFCFEKLILDQNKLLTHEQEDKIISDMELNYSKLYETIEKPYLLDFHLDLIAKYYRSKSKNEKIKELLIKYQEKLKNYIKIVRPIVAVTELKDFYKKCIENNMHDIANQTLISMQSYNNYVIQDMSILESSVTISQEKMDLMLRENISGNFHQAIQRLILKYVISKKSVLIQRDNMLDQYPLMRIFSNRTIIDNNGRITAKFSLNDDESIAFEEMKKIIISNTSLFNYFFREIISKNKKNCEDIIDYIYESPVFEEKSRETIHKGVDAFLNNDHIISVHLLIPQVEKAFRKAIEIHDGNILRSNRDDGMNFQTLDGLINHETINKIYHNDEDLIFYFRAVLSEPKGLNIRNNICHGILDSEDIDFSYSLLTIHIIFLLAQIKYEV